jgi:peptide/nickel transport system substrate-binding protein
VSPVRKTCTGGVFDKRGNGLRFRVRRRFVASLLTAVLVAAVSTVTIGQVPAGAGAKGGAKIDKTADFDWLLTYGYSNLDPHKSVSADPWLRPLYDRLVTYEWVKGKLTLIPQLAKSFKVSDDGLSITFELRDGVTFQDNTPFNAAAVKVNIERALSPAPTSTVSSNLKSISSVEVVNDLRAVIHLSAPDPSVLATLTRSSEGSMISPTAIASGVDLRTTPVGAGPYKLVSAQQNVLVTYERWDGYYDKSDIWIKQLKIHTISDANAGYNGLRSGEFDAGFVTKPLDLEAMKLPGWSSQVLLGNPFAAALNLTKPPFNNIEVRRALSMAIDRKLVEKQLLDGLGAPVFQAFPFPYLGYDAAVDKELGKKAYNPKKAKQMVQKAGASGTSIKAIYINTSPLTEYALVIQQALGDLGIKVELTPVTTSNARPTWRTGNYEMFVTGLQQSPEPALTMQLTYLAGDNLAAPPAELAEKAEKARTAPFGTKEREKLYQEISRYLFENPIHVLLNQTRYTVVARPNVVMPKLPQKNSIGDVEFRKFGIKKSK